MRNLNTDTLPACIPVNALFILPGQIDAKHWRLLDSNQLLIVTLGATSELLLIQFRPGDALSHVFTISIPV